MRDLFRDMARSLMDQVTPTMERFENKMKVHEDKLLAGLEAKMLSYSVLVPPTPGREERHEHEVLWEISLSCS